MLIVATKQDVIYYDRLYWFWQVVGGIPLYVTVKECTGGGGLYFSGFVSTVYSLGMYFLDNA